MTAPSSFYSGAYAPISSFSATSADSLLIATGPITLNLSPGKSFTVGMFVSVTSTANAVNYMTGQVTSYDAALTGQMVVSVTAIGGSGTFASWNVNLAGSPGAVGPAGSLGSLGNWKEVYSDGAGSSQPVSIGAAGTALVSTGATAAPTMQAVAVASNNLSDLTNATTARSNLGLVAVASSGSATDLTAGTLPAGRFPTLTGDVTTAGGALATTIAASAVTYAKIQNVSATSRVLGRKTAGAGVVEELIASDVSTLLGLATIATSGSATDLSAGTLPAGRFPALTGDVTTVAGALAATLANTVTARTNIGLPLAKTASALTTHLLGGL